MLVELIDVIGEQGDLDFGGARVAGSLCGEFLNRFLLFCSLSCGFSCHCYSLSYHSVLLILSFIGQELTRRKPGL